MLTKLFVLGDSVSMHYGPFLQQCLGPTFAYARKEGLTGAMTSLDIPEGANGGDSRMCLNYLKARCGELNFKPDVLLLNCGLHDIKRPTGGGERAVSREEYKANLRAMIALAQALPTQLVFLTSTPVCEAHHNQPDSPFWRCQNDVDHCNGDAREVMSAAGVPIIDLAGFSFTQGEPHELLPDGRHFAEPVRAAQGAFLAGALHGLRAAGLFA
jgi:lysophospholipase L1-like esterase